MGKLAVNGRSSSSADSTETCLNVESLDEEFRKRETSNNEDGLSLDDFDIDIPEDMVFPHQLNRYLKHQVQILTIENGNLRRDLEELKTQLSAAKQKLPVKHPAPVVGKSAEMAANKITELSKSLRERTAELEVLRNRTKDAEGRLKRFEENLVTSQTVTPPTKPDEIEKKNEQIKSLNEALQSANLKLCESRNQCQTFRHDLKLAHKVIEHETGEKLVLQDVKEGSNWRGRAQQIVALQSRLQHLQEQLSGSSSEQTVATSFIRQIEKERRASHEETSRLLNQKTMELEETRRKLEGAKARCRVLETEITQVKSRLSTVLNNEERDEQVIRALTGQVTAYEGKCKEQARMMQRLEAQIVKLENEGDIERETNLHLEKALADRDKNLERVSILLKENQTLASTNGETSEGVAVMQVTNTHTPSNMEFLPTAVAQAQKLRFLELIQVLNRRLDESRGLQDNLMSELRKEKSKNGKLETRLGRLQLERVGVSKTSRGSYGQGRSSESLVQEESMQVKHHHEYLEEECLALKTRIQTLQIEKESDLKELRHVCGNQRAEQRNLPCIPAGGEGAGSTSLQRIQSTHRRNQYNSRRSPSEYSLSQYKSNSFPTRRPLRTTRIYPARLATTLSL